MQVTQAALAKFLAKQCELGALELDDPYAAAGMLGGMMMMAPLRAVMFGRGALLTPAQIAERARTCVRLFLGGCLKDHVRALPGAAALASGLRAEPKLRSDRRHGRLNTQTTLEAPGSFRR